MLPLFTRQRFPPPGMSNSVRHSLILSSALIQLVQRFNGAFHVATGLSVIVNGLERQPDLVVFAKVEDQGCLAIDNAVMVVEVVSPTTRVVDRFDKNVDYASAQSIKHYLMLAEDRPYAVLCSRLNDEWVSTEREGAGIVPLPALGIELPLDELYRRVEFPDQAG